MKVFKKFILVCIINMQLLGGVCLAATYYISDTDGNDSRSAIQAQNSSTPWKSLYKASVATSNGDTILLKRGDAWTVTRHRRGTDWNPSGEGLGVGVGLTFSAYAGGPTQDVTIGAYGTGNKPIIDARAETDIDSDEDLIHGYSPIGIGGYAQGVNGGFTIRDLDIRGPKNGHAVQMSSGGNGNKIINCELSGGGWNSESLVTTTGSNHTIEDCLFDTISSNSTGYSKGIEIKGGSGHIIRRNTFYGIASDGAVRFANGWTGFVVERNFFYQPDSRRSYAWAIVCRSADGGTGIIRNNIIDLTNSGGISGTNLRGVTWWDDHAATTRKIYNNTIVSEGVGRAIYGSNLLYLFNNIIYNFQEAFSHCNSSTHGRNNLIYDTNLVWDCTPGTDSGNIITNNSTDINFIDSSGSNNISADFETVQPSDAIDGGYGVPGSDDIPLVDYLGRLRQDVDIGAYEFDGRPLPPKNLRILN